MPTWPSPMLAAGFTYASDTVPSNPKEGETWYDTGSNEAKVYDGSSWAKLTVTDHAELGSVSAGQHRTDSNIISTVDGAAISIGGDADTVDGQHASDLGASSTTTSYSTPLSIGSPGNAASAYPWGYIESISYSANCYASNYSVTCNVDVWGPEGKIFSDSITASGDTNVSNTKNFSSRRVGRVQLSFSGNDTGSVKVSSMDVTTPDQ